MTTPQSDRNLVLVTVDSLRADHCGFLNDDSGLTPNIDSLARNGLKFEQAIAPGPRTPSSVPVFFTGEFMTDDPEWTMTDWQGRQTRIGEHMLRFGHLSERFQRRGYDTAAITANPWTTRETNFDDGFDKFYEISADSDDISSRMLSDSTLFKTADAGFEALPTDPVGWSKKKEWFAQWPGYFELIADQLDKLTEPFFLWIFILDTHQPYITPCQYREDAAAWEMYYSILRYWRYESDDKNVPDHAFDMIKGTYRDAMRSVDAFTGRLRETVEPYDPVTVFSSDHGEAHGEHGNFGHEQTLYEENLRTPFIVHNAAVSGTVTDQFPLRALSDLLVDATDKKSTFDPTAHTQPFVVSKTENNEKAAVRTPGWKFISDGETTRLFNLHGDPGETTDVSDEHADVTESLSDVLARHQATQAEKERASTAIDAVVGEGL